MAKPRASPAARRRRAVELLADPSLESKAAVRRQLMREFDCSDGTARADIRFASKVDPAEVARTPLEAPGPDIDEGDARAVVSDRDRLREELALCLHRQRVRLDRLMDYAESRDAGTLANALTSSLKAEMKLHGLEAEDPADERRRLSQSVASAAMSSQSTKGSRSDGGAGK